MFNIGIDGPSASGKSTIAKALAKKLKFTHIDTGAMYRAIAYDCLKNKIDLEDEASCVEHAEHIKLELVGDNQIFLNDNNITRAIRSEAVSKAASKISKYKRIREILVALQREIASKKGFVLDGRDITSVVLKDAELKIYQTADVKVRAQRRFYELVDKGHQLDFQDVYDDLVARDDNDMNRKESPLIKVKDAVEIDTTHLSIEESVDLIMGIIQDRGLV